MKNIEILAYNIQPILSLEVVHIAGDIDAYYFGYRILDCSYMGNKVKAYESGFATDYEAMRAGTKALNDLASKIKKERDKQELPF